MTKQTIFVLGWLHHKGRNGKTVEEFVEGTDRQSFCKVRLGRRRTIELCRVSQNDDQRKINEEKPKGK